MELYYLWIDVSTERNTNNEVRKQTKDGSTHIKMSKEHNQKKKPRQDTRQNRTTTTPNSTEYPENYSRKNNKTCSRT